MGVKTMRRVSNDRASRPTGRVVNDLATFSGSDLRELAALADLRDQRRTNNLQALYRGPTIGAFVPGAPPLPALSPEELGSAVSALARHGWSIVGLLRGAEGYSAGRAPSEVIDRVVVDVLVRRRRGEL